MNQLKGKMKLYLFTLLLCIGYIATAQTITVTGMVLDNVGETLPGVNILVRGTTTGTFSSVDGSYSLTVLNVEFSFVGFTTVTEFVGNRRVIKVAMQEDQQRLEEVAVIGYGTMKRSDLTGAVGSISLEEVVKKGTTSIMDALQGAIAGVDISMTSNRPGSRMNIRVRGQNSLNPGNPLYVVDGIITSDIDFLNPSDIEKVVDQNPGYR